MHISNLGLIWNRPVKGYQACSACAKIFLVETGYIKKELHSKIESENINAVEP